MIKTKTEELVSLLAILEEQIETIKNEIDDRQIITQKDMEDEFGFSLLTSQDMLKVYEKDLGAGLMCNIVLDLIKPSEVFINLMARKRNLTSYFNITSFKDFEDLLTTLQLY